jgi:ABC-type thiamine transport system ATPase subunit
MYLEPEWERQRYHEAVILGFIGFIGFSEKYEGKLRQGVDQARHSLIRFGDHFRPPDYRRLVTGSQDTSPNGYVQTVLSEHDALTYWLEWWGNVATMIEQQLVNEKTVRALFADWYDYMSDLMIELRFAVAGVREKKAGPKESESKPRWIAKLDALDGVFFGKWSYSGWLEFDDRYQERAMAAKGKAEKTVLVILGQSGSGKSTMLRLIVGILQPTSGLIFYRLCCIQRLSRNERNLLRARIGMVFQYSALISSMTVRENLALPLEELEEKSPEEIEAMVKEKLALVGMSGAEDKFPGELSGGMRKRISLARALMMDPELILFDEPVAIESSNSYLPMRIGRYSWCTRKSTSWMNRYVARCIFTRCWLRISRGAAPATPVGVLKSAATICSVPSVPASIWSWVQCRLFLPFCRLRRRKRRLARRDEPFQNGMEIQRR